MLATESTKAIPMLVQNCNGDCSQCTKMWRTVGDVGSAKYGKSTVAKNGLRAAGDIRKVANGHSTAMRIARKVTPPKSACCHLGDSLNMGHTRSSSSAGTKSRIGN